MVFLFVRRTLVWCLLVSLSAGCKAQSPPSTAANSASPVPTPQLNRRIEVLVRSQFEVPPNVDVAIGATSKSEFPGFENLPITFSSHGKQTVVNFLLSSDGNTVARLERFDISHSPADTISDPEPSFARDARGQGHDREFRRPGVPLLRARCTSSFFRPLWTATRA